MDIFAELEAKLKAAFPELTFKFSLGKEFFKHGSLRIYFQQQKEPV